MEIGKIKGVCPVCGAEEVHIGQGISHLTDEDHNNLLDYRTWTCTCHACGAPVYNKRVEALNRVLDAEAVRSIADRLPLKTIRGLPKRYDISRADFCRVMGVPKMTMEDLDEVEFKLFDGDLPDKALEERLRMIHEDPKKWIEFLKAAEGRISREVYEKSYKRAEEIIGKL